MQPCEPFRTLLADPPWPFKDKLPGPGRGAEKHYHTMSVEELCNLPMPPLNAEGCLLVMWRVSAMVEEAYQVCRAWGFVPKSELVWRKLTSTGKRHFGMGRYVRLEHESAIIAVRGKVQVLDRSIRSVFDAPVGRHSEKPEEARRIIERLSPGPYCELFARRLVEGWTCLGDEL